MLPLCPDPKITNYDNVILNSTQLNSTGDYGRRCLTPLCPHHNHNTQRGWDSAAIQPLSLPIAAESAALFQRTVVSSSTQPLRKTTRPVAVSDSVTPFTTFQPQNGQIMRKWQLVKSQNRSHKPVLKVPRQTSHALPVGTRQIDDANLFGGWVGFGN